MKYFFQFYAASKYTTFGNKLTKLIKRSVVQSRSE